MKKHTFNRRDFLKGAGRFLAGMVLFRLQRMFGLTPNPDKDRHPPLKEAKYYTSGDNLAG